MAAGPLQLPERKRGNQIGPGYDVASHGRCPYGLAATELLLRGPVSKKDARKKRGRGAGLPLDASASGSRTRTPTAPFRRERRLATGAPSGINGDGPGGLCQGHDTMACQVLGESSAGPSTISGFWRIGYGA